MITKRSLCEKFSNSVFLIFAQGNMSNFLIKLGFDAVAYNFMATPPLDKKHRHLNVDDSVCREILID